MQGVIFDLYGTLIDLSQKSNPYGKLFRDLKVDHSKAKQIALTENCENLEQLACRLQPGHQLDLCGYQCLVDQEIASAYLYPETLEVLGQLRMKGMKIGVISNLAAPYRKPFFQLGLDKLVDTYLFSCEMGVRKPDEKIYRNIIEQWALSPQHLLMVGDSIPCDVEGPRSLGIRAIHLDRSRASHSQQVIANLYGIFTL